MATIDDLADYRGPLGAVEVQLARRRIAVATDRGGRISLVRPDSVIVDIADKEFKSVKDVVKARGLDVLGGMPRGRPRSGRFGARSVHVGARPTRWSIDGARRLADDLRHAGLRVRPNQVYLADGVSRHYGIVGEGSVGTPGLLSPTSLESTVRPALALAQLRSPLRLRGHRRPRMLVLDTGLRTLDARAEHPDLTNCIVHERWRDRRRTGRWDDEDEPDDDGAGRLDYQAGHGTFISGIIRQLCPDAEVHHSGVLTSYGDGDDASVIAAIERAVRRLAAKDCYDIVVMSFGTYGAQDEAPPLADAIGLLTSSVVVASAGNDATSRRYYPAALPGVIAVAALDSGGRAAFSNFGGWVDACAPGVDVVSTFFTNFDDTDPDGSVVDRYRGWASWSGTSFAAPRVAATIAEEMYLYGGSAADAWGRLSHDRRYRAPDLGVVFNV